MTDVQITPPARDEQQRMAALAEANRIRIYRAHLKTNIKAKRITAADVILDPPKEALTMKVWDLLLSMPRVGRVKASRRLMEHRISAAKTIGGLTHRQRYELGEVLS